MKLKNFFLLFIFGLFFLLLPGDVGAFCNAYVHQCYYEQYPNCHLASPGDPYFCTIPIRGPLQPVNEPPVGITSTYVDQYVIGECGLYCGTGTTGVCADSDGWTAISGRIPNTPTRPFCRVIHAKASGLGCTTCNEPGLIDSEVAGKCIQCNYVTKTESQILGTASQTYNPCSSPPGVTGDGQCESACGADTACDEIFDGSQCTVGRYCEALGRNCLSEDTCSGCVCIPGAKPTISFSPSSFSFTAAQGGSNPANQTLEIWNSGTSGTTLSWSVSDNATWLTLSPTSGSSTGEHDNVTLSVSISGMTAGSYSATITISDPNATNNPQTVPVSLNITGPNLQITDIEEFNSDKKVHYTIHNQGEASTGAGFNCSLYVGGSYKEYQYFSNSLSAGLYRDGVFSNWTCTAGQTYSIKVCADDKNGVGVIDESDEADNCRTESLTCPGVCSGTLNVSITGSGTCNVTARIYPSSGCTVELYRILENGGERWSGALDGDNTITRTGTVGVGSYDYDLEFYTDGWRWQDDDKNNSCPEEECSCTGWTNQSCGYSSCAWYEKGRTRTCTPSGCDTELECFCDESCCSTWVDQDCGPTGGCAETEMYQTRDCGTCSYSESQCVSDPSCGGVVTINPPVVMTIADTTISEDPDHPGKYRAILTGYLDSLGYDPGTCPNCKCIVWFEWGTSGTEGVSGSYGNSNTPVEMTTEDDYFYYTADNLDPGTTFKFEAFAKNGGSW